MKRITMLTTLISTILITSSLVLSQTELFKDDFNTSPLDVTNKWRIGDNSGSAVSIASGLLQLNLIDDENDAWVITQDAFPLGNTTITVKIVKATKDGSIGICPSYPKADNDEGIYYEANWYRFKVGRDNLSDPDEPEYKLYVYKRKQGFLFNPVTVTLPYPYGGEGYPFHMRLRFDNSKIYFEFSTTNESLWELIWQEVFDLPAYSLNNAFHAEIAAIDNSQGPGTLKVDDFKVLSSSTTPTIARIILDDPLNSSTFANRKTNPELSALKVDRSYVGSSSNFSISGWKPSGDLDLVAYDLGRYIEKGSLEIDVTQFEPGFPTPIQNSMERHHVLAMFRMPWGGHHPVEKLETIRDLHTGLDSRLAGGIKFYAHTYDYQDEDQHFVTDATSDWDKTKTHHLTIYWEPNQIKYLHDGVLRVTHPIVNEMQLRYIYVGRDLTVSGDLETEFNKNQYSTMRDADGPIYFNVVAKELRSIESTAPSITGITIADLYDNAARISWQTNESSVCYVKYGTSTSYDQQTKMLGTPTTSFTTLLTGLNSNQAYNYKIIAEDNAGNVTESNNQTFTTTTSGVYVFTPAADTYIERNREDDDAGAYSHLYGKTRAFGNYHWMNLMSAKGRYCYLKFKIPNTISNIRPITLRLYSRQGGQSGVDLYQFEPVSSDWATTVTWADQASVGGDSDAEGFQDSDGGVTGPLLGSILSPMNGNQWYSFSFANPQSLVSPTEGSFKAYHFALKGVGSTPAGTAKLTQDVSFDSGESTNNQPELIIVSAPTSFTEASFSLPGVEEGDAVWGDYDKDINPDDSQDLDILITGLGATGPLSKIYRNNKSGATISFVDLNASLEALSYSAADWGDFDMDNTLDILLAGQPSSGAPVTKVYRNDYNGNFSEKTTSLIGIKYGDVAWGNYDNNRCLDILLSGWGSAINFATKVYKGNFSSNNYTWAAQTITLPQLRYSSVAWGHNNPSTPDGYLDLLLAGTKNTTPATDIIEMYKNTADGGFELATNQLPSPSGAVGMTASCVWGNFDTDDDLDVAFAGRLTQVRQLKNLFPSPTHGREAGSCLGMTQRPCSEDLPP